MRFCKSHRRLSHICSFNKCVTIVLFCLWAGSLYSQTQSVGTLKLSDNTGTFTYNTDALIDMQSNAKGLLLPRVALTSTASASPLSAFTAGMAVYNTNTTNTGSNDVTPGYYFSDGSKWIRLAGTGTDGITIAGTATALGGSVTQDQITGLSSTGLVKRTAANTLGVATAGTDYITPSTGSSLTSLPSSTGLYPTLNQNTTGTAANVTATSNSTLTALPNLVGIGTLTSGSIPYSLITGTPGIPTTLAGLTGDVTIGSAASGQLLRYNGTVWQNWTPNYLTSYTEGDPVYTASSWYGTTNNHTNWDAAYTNRILSATGTAPLNLSLSANALTGSIIKATTSVDGYLSSMDWNTFNNKQGALTVGSIANSLLANSSITVAGTATALGGIVTQDQITGLSSTGLVKRTAANTLGVATAGTDYITPSTGSSLTSLPSSTGLYPTLNQNTTGTAANVTATSNSTLTALPNLVGIGTLTSGSIPYSLITGTPGIPTTLAGLTGDVTISSAASGQLLRYNGTVWQNWTPNYLTSYTETDPVYSASSWYGTTNNHTNWDAAYTNRITSLTTTGASGAATLSGNTLNIPQYTLAGLGGISANQSITYTASGDVTGTASGTTSISPALTLATVNSNTGSFGSATSIATLTVNGKGLVTAISNTTISGLTTANLSATAGITNAQLANPTQWITNGSNIYYSTGNVGINTTTPAYKLDVVGGDVRFNGITLGLGVSQDANSLALGTGALGGASNTGSYNTSIGAGTLALNTTGSGNTALGAGLLGNNTTGNYNIAAGFAAMQSNSGGSNNIGLGYQALKANSSGTYNIGLGYGAGKAITTGIGNIALGYNAISSVSTANYNVSIGYSSGGFISGTSNTILGYSSGGNISTGSNNTCIGNGAVVPTGTADNQIKIGNAAITYAGVQVAWTVTSDRNLKHDIKESNLGLSFINQLKPVSYIRNGDVNNKIEYGLIAQEVDSALTKKGVTNSMVSKDDNGTYSIRYNDLLSPIIKSIQELSTKIETLKKENKELKKKIANLKNRNKLKRCRSLHRQHFLQSR